MQQITLEIADDYMQKFMALLNALPANKITGHYTYIDDLGDTIKVVGNEEFVIPTQDDINALNEAKIERNNNESFSLEAIRKARNKNV